MIRAVDSEPTETKGVAEKKAKSAENWMDVDFESPRKADRSSESSKLDRQAVEEWRKVYIDMYGG